jgi:hypothetical protein
MTPSGETIRIEAETRWDALDLARRLSRHHTYLVQLGDRRWNVCVRTDDAGLELEPVRAVAEGWAVERRLESKLRRGAETYRLHGP